MPQYAPLEAILRLCAAAAPVPWYPKAAAAELGLRDEDLAAFVEQLRGGGLVARTDPVPGHGRGYVLTPAGVQALSDPGALEWLRRGEVPPRPAGEATEVIPERERAVRMSLLAPFTPYVTRGLIVVNVLVFLWAVYLGQRQGLKLEDFLYLSPRDIAHATGAVSANDVLTPGWGYLRLLTCCFVHFGMIHLAVNMLSLYFVGPLLERMWGHVRYLVLYLIAGLGGSCAAMVLRPLADGNVVMLAGASGALWGLLASLAVWVLLNRRYLPRRLLSSWGTQIFIVFLINIALTYKMSGALSAEAHYGGGIVGAVCAVLLHGTRFGPVAVRVVAGAAVAALPAFGLWAVAHPERYSKEWAKIPAAAERAQKEADERERDRERLDLNKVLPAAREAEDAAVKAVPDMMDDAIIGKHWSRRDDDEVRRAVEQYGKAEAALRPAGDLLRQAGPYRDERVEKARQVRLGEIEARLELLAQNKRCLEAGKDWSREDEEKREEAIKRVRDLEREWGKLLQ
jgi:rhomboid protease GluP